MSMQRRYDRFAKNGASPLDGVYEYKKKVRRQTAYDRIRKGGP